MEIIEKIITDRQSRDMEHSQEPRTEKGDHSHREERKLMNSDPDDQEDERATEWGDVVMLCYVH